MRFGTALALVLCGGLTGCRDEFISAALESDCSALPSGSPIRDLALGFADMAAGEPGCELSLFSGFDTALVPHGILVDVMSDRGFVCRAMVTEARSPHRLAVVPGTVKRHKLGAASRSEVIAVYPSDPAREKIPPPTAKAGQSLEEQLPQAIRDWLKRSRRLFPQSSDSCGVTSFADHDGDGSIDIVVVDGPSASGDYTISWVLLWDGRAWLTIKRICPA